MSLTLECTEHPEYTGATKPEYDCVGCRSLRLFCLDASPDDTAGQLQNALAFGALRVVEPAAPARPEASTDDCICGSYGQRDHTHACWLALVKRLARLVAEGTEAKSEPAGHTGQASAYQPCNHSRTVPYRGGKRCADCGAHKVGH